MMPDRDGATDLAAQRMLRSALAYVERLGLYVFPLWEVVDAGSPDAPDLCCACPAGAACTSPGKHPRSRRGIKDASADPARIRDWWGRWPQANIGAALAESLAVVLDVDGQAGGDEALSAFQRQHGPLPATPCCVTGSGGQRYFFLRPEGDRVAGKALARGLELRADDAYVVLPPSSHIGGRTHAWADGANLKSTPCAPLPAWLAARLEVADAPATPRPPRQGLVGAAFEAAGWLGKALGPGKAAARCPWENEHESGQRYDGLTVVLGPEPGKVIGDFHCGAPGCRARAAAEALSRAPEDAMRTARARLGVDPAFAPGGAPPAAAPAAKVESWESGLVFNDEGAVTKDVGNASIILRNVPEWRGVLAFNSFASRIELLRDAPPLAGLDAPQAGPLRDDHFTFVAHWLRKARGVSFARQAVYDAVGQAARQNTHHPVKEYLDGLSWDGTPRLAHWLHTYLEADDDEYTSCVGRWWMLAGVDRAYNPGCQADHVLILEGVRQGEGKSTTARILGGPWTLGRLPDLQNKDAMDALYGYWIVEVAELDAFRGASFMRVKDFVTQITDVFRPAYGRVKEEHRRSCVFLGTTNERHYLRDPTGARRFWPVRVRQLDRSALESDRDQLWAEAVANHHDGAQHHPTQDMMPEIRRQQELRFEPDPWEDLIGDHVGNSEWTTMGSILRDALKLEPRDQSKVAQDRVAHVLHRLGYESKVIREGDGVLRRWVRTGPATL